MIKEREREMLKKINQKIFIIIIMIYTLLLIS